MLSFQRSTPHHSALMQHTACIVFTPNGVIKEASPLFLKAVGYSLKQVVGQHHRMFCFTEESSQPEYTTFWHNLAAGESQQGRFRRLNSTGDEIWLEATYLPIKNRRGNVVQVLKVASDVTQKHQNAARERAILQALDSSMAVIEFTPDGHVLDANSNFEQTMGYSIDQIRDVHHRKFCSPVFYQQHPDFWERLSRGEFMQGKFERIDARGNTIWLEATYNPIHDGQGQIIKVVKFATDITRSVQASEAAQGHKHHPLRLKK